jgi:hypothetical protein
MYFFVLFLGTAVFSLSVSVIFAYQAKNTETIKFFQKRWHQEQHVFWIKLFYVTTFAAVISIIFVVRENNGSWGSLPLQHIHRTTVVILTVLLPCIFFYWNGNKNIAVHRKIVYIFLFFLIVALITGSMLFSQHPKFL